ncbi:hypothetical protein [Frankia sp. CiP3]|uniref:hypothetical protein n=1 Tax=Frankia sp. CiP3 TaxID=2880971 RepID=UPI001EF3E747|nr:hypothetical protein [Frankia sp. CiP3]
MYVNPVTFKLLVVALASMSALVVAIVTGLLARHAGMDPASAVLRGGTAFGGTLALAVAVLAAVGVL